MKNYELSDKYEAIGEKVKAEHWELHWIDAVGARIGYLTCDDEKHIGEMTVNAECIKVPEIYKVFVPYDFLIVVYEVNISHMNEEQRQILIYHELKHCDFAEAKDGDVTWKLKRHDIEDFSVILERYGLHWAKDLVSGEKSESQEDRILEESIDGEV